MKTILDTVETITRISKDNLNDILSTIQLVSILDSITNNTNEIAIPKYGKIIVDKDFNLEFVPDTDFKRTLYNSQKDPNHYLKNELKKLLNIEEYISE